VTVSSRMSLQGVHDSNVNTKQLFIWGLRDVLCKHSKREELRQSNIWPLYNTIIVMKERKKERERKKGERERKRRKKKKFIFGKIINNYHIK
jgi:hypothetical protein